MAKPLAIADRPLTKQMIKTLMDCHNREQLKSVPIDAAITPAVKGLVLRGVVSMRRHTTISGKTFVAVFITDKGRRVLKEL